MNSRLFRLLALVAASLASVPVHASLTISNAPTANVNCSAGVCSATASSAVLNVTDLTNLLANGSVTVKSTSKAVDIVVADTFSWVSTNGLTLDSFHAIAFQQPVVVAGPGSLAIATSDGGTKGDFQFAKKGRVEFWDLGSSLEIDGHAYVLVKSLKQLAAKIAHDPQGFYALSRNHNAAKDGIYSGSPVSMSFAGSFEGLGNTIQGLAIDDTAGPSDLGMFAQLAAGGVVRDVKLANVDITGAAGAAIGALVGDNLGSVKNSAVSGVVNAGAACVGSLVGSNDASALVSGSRSTATLQQSSVATQSAGGLVGCNAGTIRSSASKGAVTGSGSFSNIGGVTGHNLSSGLIASASASGKVNSADGDSIGGGVAGLNEGAIQASSATGDVANCLYGGGLVGDNYGAISQSYATGAVDLAHAPNSGGGLVGVNLGSIVQSYATGSVTGEPQAQLGGLVGSNDGSIEDAYSRGAATGDPSSTRAGGLVGDDSGSGSIMRAYSTGAPQGEAIETGGSVGLDNSNGGDIASDYWDTSTSGITNLSQGAGNVANDPGITGRTTAQLQSGLPVGFSSSVWGEAAGINGGLPYLLALPTK